MNNNAKNQVNENAKKALLELETVASRQELATSIYAIVNDLNAATLNACIQEKTDTFATVARIIKNFKGAPLNECTPSEVLKMYSYKIVNALNRSNLTGKMKDINSVSTLLFCNTRCISRMNSGNEKCICTHCYAKRIYANNEVSYIKNTLILCFFKLDFNGLYIVAKNPQKMVRFESFGDLINTIQARNYIDLASVNPFYNFALWTKNPDILNAAGVAIPENMNIIKSGVMICTGATVESVKLDIEFDKLFIVCDTPETSERLASRCKLAGVDFAYCGARSCASCRHCYTDKKKTVVIEKLK